MTKNRDNIMNRDIPSCVLCIVSAETHMLIDCGEYLVWAQGVGHAQNKPDQ